VELWLIRHALPLRIDGGDAPADPGLAEAGWEQARQLADWWGRFPVDAMYSSPMRRARETAEPLSDRLGLAASVDDELEEFDAHLAHYIPIEDLRADPVAWQRAVAEWTSPEAEAERLAFRERVVAAIDRIAARHPDGRVALVCHGGVINGYLATALGLPGSMFFEPIYTSVSRVSVRGTHRTMVSINETPHLGEPTVPSTAR
jgi:probable phosphoglycerate mutase